MEIKNDHQDILIKTKTKLVQANIKYNSYELDKIESKYIEEMFRKMGKNYQKDTLEKIYREVDGNLWSIILYDDENEFVRHPTFEDINQKQFILYYIIALFRYPVKIKDIKQILDEISITANDDILMINNLLTEMIEKKYITKNDNDEYSLSVYAKFNLDKIMKPEIFNVVHEALVTYNFSAYNNDAKFEYLYNLIFLFSLGNDQRINKLFIDLRTSLPKTESSHCILNEIEEIINGCQGIGVEFKNKMYLEVIILAFLCGYLEIAKKILNFIYNSDDVIHRILKGKLLSEGNEKNISILKELLDNEIDAQARISLQLDLLHLYMKYKSNEYVNEYVKPILTDSKNSHYMEFVFIIKNLTIYKNHDLACDVSQRCVEKLVELKCYEQIDRVEISWASRLAQAGKLDEAQTIYKALLDKHYDPSLNIGYLYNNLGVVQLLKGDSETLNSFEQAALFVNGAYEKLLITNNYLVYYLMQNNQDFHDEKVEQYVNFIEERYKNYQFDEFLHIVYLNLFNYFTLVNNVKKMKFYFNSLKQLKEQTVSNDLKLFIDKTLYGTELSKHDKWYIMSTYTYRPAFLGYWGSGLNMTLF